MTKPKCQIKSKTQNLKHNNFRKLGIQVVRKIVSLSCGKKVQGTEYKEWIDIGFVRMHNYVVSSVTMVRLSCI